MSFLCNVDKMCQKRNSWLYQLVCLKLVMVSEDLLCCVFLLICGCFVFVKAPAGGAVCTSTWRGLSATGSSGRSANPSLTTFRIMGTLGSLFLATTSEECSKQRVINIPFS